MRGNVARGNALDFLGSWTGFDIIRQYLVEALCDSIGIGPWLYINLDIDKAAVDEWNEIRRRANSSLFLTDKDIVQTRTRQSAKRAQSNEQRIRVGIGKTWHNPIAINTRGRHLVLHDDFDVFFERWHRRIDWGHIFAPLNLAEPFFHQRLRLGRIDVTGQHKNSVVRTIMVREPCLHVIQRGRRQVFKTADRVVVIGVTFGEQCFGTLVINEAKWLIVALTLFIRNNANLVV